MKLKEDGSEYHPTYVIIFQVIPLIGKFKEGIAYSDEAILIFETNAAEGERQSTVCFH